MDTPNLTGQQKLPVMEAFYTLQGEGAHSGKAAYFIRLAGCDVGCVWCDVKESWEISSKQYLSTSEIVQNALEHNARLAVITGGEPCMHDLNVLIEALHEQGFQVNIETSGAYEITGIPDWICVSPKKFKEPLLNTLQKADELKVVVFHSSDFEFAEKMASMVGPECQLYLQPEFSKANKMSPLIVDYIKLHPNWRLSLQTHKYIGIP